MDWIAGLAAAAPALVSAFFAFIAAAQNKSAKNAVASIQPTMAGIVTALAEHPPTIKTEPATGSVAELVESLMQLRLSIEAHTEAINALKEDRHA